MFVILLTAQESGGVILGMLIESRGKVCLRLLAQGEMYKQCRLLNVRAQRRALSVHKGRLNRRQCHGKESPRYGSIPAKLAGGGTAISLTAEIHQNDLAGDSFPPRSHENRRFFLHADKVWLFLLTAMTCIVFTTLAAVT